MSVSKLSLLLILALALIGTVLTCNTITASENITSVGDGKAYIMSTGIPDREYVKTVYDCEDFSRDLALQMSADNVTGGLALIVYVKDGKAYKAHATNFIQIGNYFCKGSPQTGRVSRIWDGGVIIKVD